MKSTYILPLLGLFTSAWANPYVVCVGISNPTGDPNNPSTIFGLEIWSFVSDDSLNSLCRSMEEKLARLQTGDGGFTDIHGLNPGFLCEEDQGSMSMKVTITFPGDKYRAEAALQSTVYQAFGSDGATFSGCNL